MNHISIRLTKKLIRIYYFMLIFLIFSSFIFIKSYSAMLPDGEHIIDDFNNPPEPQTPEGPTTGYTNTNYEFKFIATDPDDDKINYTINWGNRVSGPFGPYDSGQEITLQNSWETTGNYWIVLTAKDEHGGFNWSNPLIIEISACEIGGDNDNNETDYINNPPVPKTPEGPTTGYTNTNYEFNFTATDPENDNIYYKIDWGCESDTEWLGPYNSGETITQQHNWITPGTYDIVLISKDEHGEINESNPLSIEISDLQIDNAYYQTPPPGDDDDDNENTNYNNNYNSNNNQEEDEEKNEQEPTALSYYQENQGNTNNGKYNLPSIIGTLTNTKNLEISWTIIITTIITIITMLTIYLIKTKNIYLTNKI